MKRGVKSTQHALKNHSVSPANPSNKYMFSLKKYYPILIASFVLIFSLILFWPIDRTETLTQTVGYTTRITNSKAYELGDTRVAQDGRPGEKIVTLSVRTTMFNQLFGINGHREEVSSKITVAPIRKEISKGTKKYQYMLCTDGSYRYYSEKLFKDPANGFTSKSEDFCAKFNQGKKSMLADNPDGSTQQDTVVQFNQNGRQHSAGSRCKKINIVKYKTSYRNDPYLPKNVKETAIYGYDGYTFICPSTGYKDVVPPSNAVVDVGTGEDADRQQEAARITEEQSRAAETQARNLRVAQCISNMRVRIPQGGSALEYAIRLCYSNA